MGKSEFSISVMDAGGPIQLQVMNEKSGRGIRLLGSKGSPYRQEIKRWGLSREQIMELIEEIKSVISDEDAP